MNFHLYLKNAEAYCSCMNIYSQQNNDLLHTEGKINREYILKIRDLPPEDKPRERLLKYGPQALSVNELLSVILTTGTKKEGVLSMTQRIIREYGEKSVMYEVSARKMSHNLNIPVIKACQIVACSELGKRFYRKDGGGLPLIRTAKDVYEYFHDMHNLSKEHLRGIYLNTHNRIIHDEVISIGTINANLVHPREVFRPAIEYGAAAIILAHNHPSHESKPSSMDIEITKQLIKVGNLIGINILDHVIITKNTFESINVNYL